MYIEKVATVGLGYLVYKGIMAELAKEAVTPPITTEKWTGEQAQAKRQQISEAEGWQGMFFRKGTFPEGDFLSTLFLTAKQKEAGCYVDSAMQTYCPPPKGKKYTYTGPPQYCRTDWAGIKRCTTTPPTITMPLDMTGVTIGDVVAGIDYTGYEDLERFFR